MATDFQRDTDLSILLADDDKDDCLLFKEALEELVITTNFTTIHDGEKLMSYLQESTSKLPTVLFLDLNMPRKNGFMCIEEIKQNEKLQALPVVIFSTSFDESIAEKLYNSGAHYYICKPANFTELKKLIEQTLSLVSSTSKKQPSKKDFVLSKFKTIPI